jgi:hypothetical protein
MTDRYGGVDYTVTTLQDGDDFRTTSEGGAFSTAYGAYHGQHWQSNENGVVTLRTEFREASDPNELAFQHPEDPQYRVAVLGLTQTQPQEYVLDVNPPNGIDEHLYYNAQTFLLDREVRFERDRYAHTTDYADYRRMFGKMIAQHIHSYDGRPLNDYVETVVAYVHELGLTTYGRSSATIGGGDVDIGSVRIPQMTIGPLQLRDVAFDTVPFDQSTDKDARLVGLMGFDFLASAITEIDFKAGTLTLYPRSAFKANVPGMRALDMQLDDGVPRVSASVEGVEGNFLVDTGAFATLAYRDFVRKLPSTPRDPERTAIGTVGGEMPPITSTFDIMDYDGIIGRNALSVYQVYFDYPDRILFLKSNI